MADIFIGGKNQGPATEARPEAREPDFATDVSQTDVAKELALKPYQLFFDGISPEQGEKLTFLLRQLNPNHKLEAPEVIAKMRKIEARLGSPNLGESRLERVYRYVKLVSTARELMLEAL